MPSATFSESVAINVDPPEVWDQLQEPDVWASLGPVQKVWDPVFKEGVLTGFTWSTDIGGKVYEGTGKVLDHRRPDRYQLVLDTSEMAGTITAELSPANPGGTDAVVEIEIRSKGLLSSMFFPAIKNAIGSGFPEQVSDMGIRLSSTAE
jgi:carbon monoxide dehydrogenase subunit G